MRTWMQIVISAYLMSVITMDPDRALTFGKVFVISGIPLKRDIGNITLQMVTISYKVPHVTVTITIPNELTLGTVSIQLHRLKMEQHVLHYKSRSYLFDGDDFFGIIALVADASGNIIVTHMMSVNAWGRMYYVVTATTEVFISIVTAESASEVRFMFKLTSPTKLVRRWTKFKRMNFADVLTVHMTPYDHYWFHDCVNDPYIENGCLTGTRVEGTAPIGVISGSCQSYVRSSCCDAKGAMCYKTRYGDGLGEMLLPVEMFGREYITFPMEHTEYLPLVMLIASEPLTRVTLFLTYDGYNETMHLEKAGDYVELSATSISCLIQSNKAIQVVQFLRSGCWWMNPSKDHVTPAPGESSFTILIPSALFYHTYFWSTPTINRKSYPYIIVILPHEMIDALFINNVKVSFDSFLWSPVAGLMSWKVGSRPSDHGAFEIYSEQTVYFGFYIYGVADTFGYIAAVGFIAAPINVNFCKPSKRKDGDLIDNDCDGKVDEEKHDKKDDDKDGQVDEDLKDPSRVAGAWALWQHWRCTANCSDSRMVRMRTCTNPTPRSFGKQCPDHHDQFKNGTCYKDKFSCPRDCDFQRWGEHCANSCPHCVSDCHKFTGVCDSCMVGYYMTNGVCEECEVFYYGTDCEQSCAEKCAGKDCVNRTNGECPKAVEHRKERFKLKNFVIVAAFMTVIALVAVCFEVITRYKVPSNNSSRSETGTTMFMSSGLDSDNTEITFAGSASRPTSRPTSRSGASSSGSDD